MLHINKNLKHFVSKMFFQLKLKKREIIKLEQHQKTF